MQLLDRVQSAFDEIANDTHRSFIQLLVRGEDLADGAERDLAGLAVDMKLTMEDVKEMAALVAELRKLLPLVAEAPAHQQAHTELTRKVNAARDILKAKIAELEAEFKKLWILKSASDGKGLQITTAKTRVRWIELHYNDLFRAVVEHHNITLPAEPRFVEPKPVEPPSPAIGAPAPKDEQTDVARAPADSTPDPICLPAEPAIMPRASTANTVAAGLADLRAQTRADRMTRLDRRSREQ